VFFLITVTQQKGEAEGMKMSPMREVEQKKKSIPPLSQSRYGDMACETLYVHKHVQGAVLGESEPAARGIEIHQVLASYIDHLVRTRRATDLEIFDALMKGTGDEAREVLEKFRGNTRLIRRRSLPRNFTLRLMKTSFQSSIREMPRKQPSTRERLTW